MFSFQWFLVGSGSATLRNTAENYSAPSGSASATLRQISYCFTPRPGGRVLEVWACSWRGPRTGGGGIQLGTRHLHTRATHQQPQQATTCIYKIYIQQLSLHCLILTPKVRSTNSFQLFTWFQKSTGIILFCIGLSLNKTLLRLSQIKISFKLFKIFYQ